MIGTCAFVCRLSRRNLGYGWRVDWGYGVERIAVYSTSAMLRTTRGNLADPQSGEFVSALQIGKLNHLGYFG